MRPSWDEYGMAFARLAATRSRDTTQVGCAIFDERHVIVATGYNGPPPNADEAAVEWERPHKYIWMKHAEDNAMDFATRPMLDGCTLYVTGLPCHVCMRRIASKGILRVVYGSQVIKMLDAESRDNSLRLAAACGVEVVEWDSSRT